MGRWRVIRRRKGLILCKGKPWPWKRMASHRQASVANPSTASWSAVETKFATQRVEQQVAILFSLSRPNFSPNLCPLHRCRQRMATENHRPRDNSPYSCAIARPPASWHPKTPGAHAIASASPRPSAVSSLA